MTSDQPTSNAHRQPPNASLLGWQHPQPLSSLSSEAFVAWRSEILATMQGVFLPGIGGYSGENAATEYATECLAEELLQASMYYAAFILLDLEREGYPKSHQQRIRIHEAFVWLGFHAFLREVQVDLPQETAEQITMHVARYLIRRLAADEVSINPSSSEEKALAKMSGMLDIFTDTYGSLPVRWQGKDKDSTVRAFAAIVCNVVSVPDNGTKEGVAIAAVEHAEALIEALEIPGWLRKLRENIPMQSTPQDANADVGQAALARIHKQLMIDPEWTIQSDRGFGWIGSRLLQTFAASDCYENRGVLISDILVSTTIVRDVTRSAASVIEILAKKNACAVGSAFMYLPAHRSIILVSGHAIHAETLESRSEAIGSFAILQLAEAERIADELAIVAGGKVAREDHPTSGRRVAPDGMLAVENQVFVPAGSQPSLFLNSAEMEAVAHFCDGSRFATFGSTTEGICVEVPFGPSDSALITLSPTYSHPWLGSGMGITLRLRTTGSAQEMADQAALLQEKQIATVEGGGRLGAWGVRSWENRDFITWSRFVPNLLFKPNLAVDAAMAELNRAIWVDSLLFPHLPPRDAWKVIRTRAEARGEFDA